MTEKQAGLIPRIKTFLYGGVRAPRVQESNYIESPGTDATNYDSMHKDYRWFRQDELVRRCIVINAMFSTFTAGFETELEAVGDVSPEQKEALKEKYQYVKEYVDSVNKKVNLDNILFVSQIKRSVYGSAAWEIIFSDEAKTEPEWLLSLVSNQLKPVRSKQVNPKTHDYTIERFNYSDGDINYPPDEILYFENLQLERLTEKNRGLSDVEPIRDVCKARHDLLRQDIPEIVKTAWAPTIILQVQEESLAGLTVAQEDALLQNLANAVKPAKVAAFPSTVTPIVVERKVNMTGLVDLLGKFDEAIIRNFGTPTFLLSQKDTPNRAIAYAQLEAYIQSTVANIQRYFKRAIEASWYDRLTRTALKANGEQGDLPVVVKHRWNKVKAVDIYEMGKTVAALYGGGAGILAEPTFWDIAFEMMSFDKKYLEDWKEKMMPPKEAPET